MQPQTQSKIVSIWLFLCLLAAVMFVVASGTARLREPERSIEQWRPLAAKMVFATDTDIEKELEAYKAQPGFEKAFPGIGMDEFRTTYIIEYIRYILEYWLVILSIMPFLLFCIVQVTSIPNMLKLAFIFSFGALQYGVHYYMVNNMLLGDPRFVPYFLSIQVAIRYIFMGLLMWSLLSFSYPKQGIGGFELPRPSWALKILACLTLVMVFLQIMLGAAVSGMNAGTIFNTFPQMEGVWVPDGIWPDPVWYKNLFEDPTTAQFVHRLLAYGLALLIPLFWVTGNNNPHIAHLLPILFSIFVVQFLLGVLTLLFAVPLPLAVLHQANAILVFCIAVTIVHRLFIPIKAISYDIGIL